jgi:nucleoside-diphosphate-sugar epimerase
MRIFITGGSGFLGKHVIKSVNRAGHKIIASRLRNNNIGNNQSNIQWLCGDLADIESFKHLLTQFNPEVVIHLAWEGIPNYSKTISKKNLDNSINLIDYILDNTTCNKILVSGSCWEYGKTEGICNESDSVIIDSYFSWAKHSLNQYLSVKCIDQDVIFNWFRVFYLYGPGQKDKSLIPTLIKTIYKSETPQINTPMNKNDFVYVEDVAKAFARAVNVDLPSGVYNIGSGSASKVYDVCRIVEKEFFGLENISSRVLENSIQVEEINFWADMVKTKQALSMNFGTSLKDGIRQHILSMNLDARAL